MNQPAFYLLLLYSLSSCSSYRPWTPHRVSNLARHLVESDLEGQIQRLGRSDEFTSTEMEMILLHTDDIGDSAKTLPQFCEATANMQAKGRESVDSAMQRYQRLVQQMDRSDGRPDIRYDVLSDRYFEFVGTCVRTPGQAWMAAVAGLQYVGIFKERFTLDNGEKYKVIDTAKLAYNAARILLDLDGAKVDDIANSGDVASKLKVQNLQLGLLRIAVRHAVAGESEEIAPGVGLRIEYPSDLEESARSIMPSRAAIIAMMVLDMNVSYSEDKTTGAFVIDAMEAQVWKERVISSSP